jgi:hypothetical protein
MMKFKNPTPQALLQWHWQDFAPYYDALLAEELSTANLGDWMAAWTDVAAAADELFNRLYVATSVKHRGRSCRAEFQDFMENTYPSLMEKSQQFKGEVTGFRAHPRWVRDPHAQHARRSCPFL